MTLEEAKNGFRKCYRKMSKTGCWLWRKSTMGGGYGSIYVGGKTTGAHRVSYQIYKGEIPDGLMVLHKCDVPGCVNPDHLYAGTQAENLRDGRYKRELEQDQVFA